MTFPSLTYNSGVPNPPDLPSVDVPKMQVNTNSTQTYLERDHVPFADEAGAHKQVNLKETNQAGTPTLPSAPNLAGVLFETLYATTNSSQIGGNSGELYFTRGGSGIQIQLTGPLTPNPVAPLAIGNAFNGYTFMAGGVLYQWGFSTAIGTSLVIHFPNAYINIPSVVIVGNSPTQSFRLANISTNTFRVEPVGGGSSSGEVSWMAIGS